MDHQKQQSGSDGTIRIGSPRGLLPQQPGPADHGQGLQHESFMRQGLLLLHPACYGVTAGSRLQPQTHHH